MSALVERRLRIANGTLCLRQDTAKFRVILGSVAFPEGRASQSHVVIENQNRGAADADREIAGPGLPCAHGIPGMIHHVPAGGTG